MLKLPGWPRPRSGQTLIIFALISLLLMGTLGLVLDAGYDYGMRRQMQNAADAAALAGLKALTVNSASYGVLATVRQVAGQNGVTNPSDSAQLTCDVLDNSLNYYGPCGNEPYADGTQVAAVRVTLHESHPTFVMRALGNGTSNTGATATAQVTVLTQLANNQAPFIVCGLDTQTVDANGNVNGQQSILQMSPTGQYTYADGTTYPATLETPTILSSAYAINWNNRPSLPDTSLGPRFLIHKGSGNLQNGIARCNTGSSSWKGYNGSIVGTINITNTLYFTGSHVYTNVSGVATGPQSTTGNATTGNGDVQQAGQGNQVGPASNVPGAGGCLAGQDPNNCVLFVPIIDESVQGTNGTNNYVAVRRIEAFYITSNNNGGEHYGQLIENYPPRVQGTPIYQIGYTGILIYRLVK